MSSDHARATELRAIRDSRVDEIIKRMSRGDWDGARSHQQLAEQWNVSVGAVQDYAREASGVIRRIVDGDKQDILAEILAGVRHTRKLALSRIRVAVSKDGHVNEYEDPDCRTAIAADELTLRALGLIVQKTQEVAPTNLSDEQLAKELDELIAARESLRSRMKA